MPTIDRVRLASRYSHELERFAASHPRSHALFQRAQRNLLEGVPMHWMAKWAGGFPIFVVEGQGAHFTDADGHRYIDLCLGDTGAMTGHAPTAAVAAVARQAARGFTFMLPSEDHLWVAEELARRFGLPVWQFAMTATDANRFAIRLARLLTGRPKILVYNWCYHGTVDETFATLVHGSVRPRAGNLGPPIDPALTTRVVEFNDLPGLEAALAHGDVACVLAEPVMTNIGIIHPEPGYHAALRELTRRYGTLLIIDETHTICVGPGGYTAAHGLTPDLLTIGKPIGGGVPGAAYGFSREVAERLAGRIGLADCDTGGIGGTLAGNALGLAAMRATLAEVLTAEAFARTIPLAERFQAGVEEVIAEFGLPWIVKRLGCRAEYWFRPEPPRNGAEAAAAVDPELDRFMHLFALNRGILLTPFHNMALIAPDTTESDIDRHTEVFRQGVAALIGPA
ncbi:MAG TPA: aspartate aminotransferase family protein [Gemmatimonadales bacterium]|nr:aspartate aminotransferase family protein [Gemmatimonadales bacterium]